MKRRLLSIVTVFFLISCGSAENSNSSELPVKDEVENISTSSSVSGTFSVDVDSSVLKWESSKLVGSHHGVVSIVTGVITVGNGAVTQGALTVDLSTIKELDVEAEKAAKLERHLKEADFFNVSEFPTASIVVTSVREGVVYADLTLKGKTKSIEFPASILITDESVSVTAKFTINRTDWGIVFGSGNFFTDLTKEKIISDDIKFGIEIKAKK